MNARMKTVALSLALLAASGVSTPAGDKMAAPAETRLVGRSGTAVVVRMQGPADADVTLQVVCYFRRTATSDARMAGAPVELDRRLGGRIATLRASGEFDGEALETLLIDVPANTIRPRRLLLIGLGDEATLTAAMLERVGRVALREAARLGVARVAFAPLIRDQGSTKFSVGAVEDAITRGVLFAYETERRLQRDGFARPYTLEEWIVEAGPTYYGETVKGVQQAIAEAHSADQPPTGPR